MMNPLMIYLKMKMKNEVCHYRIDEVLWIQVELAQALMEDLMTTMFGHFMGYRMRTWYQLVKRWILPTLKRLIVKTNESY